MILMMMIIMLIVMIYVYISFHTLINQTQLDIANLHTLTYQILIPSKMCYHELSKVNS